MGSKRTAAIYGLSPQQPVLWLGISALLFAVPFGIVESGRYGFGVFGVVAMLFVFGTVLAVVQTVTNGSVAIAWLLPLAPDLGLSAALGSLPASIGAGAIASLFFGSTAFLVGSEIARLVDYPAPRPGRRERLAVLVVLGTTGTLFAVYYVAPLWT